MYIKHVSHKIFFQIICDINLETYKIHNKTFTGIQTWWIGINQAKRKFK